MTAAALESSGPAPRKRRGPGYLTDVVARLITVELAARDRGSLLGWLWSLAPPAFQLAATYFVFTRVFPLDIPDFPVFLLAGILAWTWFSRSLGDATVSLEVRRELVLRPGFPSEVLPITAVLVALVDYLVALPVLLLAVGLTTGLEPSALLLPAILAVQLVLCVGLGLLLAPLQVYVRDVRQVVGVVVAFGFWLTPIFYSSKQVPDSLSIVYDANPMAILIEAQRAVLLGGVVPSGGRLATIAGASLVVLTLGWAVFRRLRDGVPEQL